MTKEKILGIIKELKKKYQLKYTDTKEEEKGGKTTFIYFTIIFKVD